MTDSLDLRSIERRPTKYWDVDGLPELMMGALWIVWGGAMLLGQQLPRGPLWNAYWMFWPAFLALSGVAMTWAIRQLKARITFPRTGYVAWKEPTRVARFAAAGLAFVTAAVMAGLLAKSRVNGLYHVAAPGFGVLLSLAFLGASLRQRAPHLLALAAVALVLGMAFGASTIGGWDAVNSMMVTIGVASALVGSLRLRTFLRQHPLEARA